VIEAKLELISWLGFALISLRNCVGYSFYALKEDACDESRRTRIFDSLDGFGLWRKH
jgi:hypothetical protein